MSCIQIIPPFGAGFCTFSHLYTPKNLDSRSPKCYTIHITHRKESQMISDLHLHTRLSEDADQSAENTISTFRRIAGEKGLRFIAVTEHCDIFTSDGTNGYVNCDLDKYACEMRAEREKDGSAALLCGIELAHAHTRQKDAEEVISKYDFDFVLGSLHILRDGFDFWAVDYSDREKYPDEYLEKKYGEYTEELLEIAEKCDFDSLAHATYPLRYLRRGGRLPDICSEPSRYFPIYKDIFGALIRRGKALEINTSDVGGAGTFSPTADLLKLYKEMGGRYVTTGSDAHFYTNIGSGIDSAEKLLRDTGFEGVTVFSSRQPNIIRWS